MKKLLLLSLLAFGTSAAVTDNGKCDSKPFTLKKPVTAPATKPAPKTQEVKVVQAPKPPKPSPERKPKITTGCKQSVSK